jgi:hypothetical protein
MHVDPLRGAFGLPLPPRVGLRAVDQLFLLAVHTDHRLASGQPFTSKPVDVVELAVAVGVLGEPVKFSV